MILALTRISMLFMLFSFPSAPACAEGNENQIKAMFLINFLRYVEFPAAQEAAGLRIAVVGTSDIYDALLSVSSQKKIEGQTITILKTEPDNVVPCNILFIPENESQNLEAIARLYKGRGVLIVTENYHHLERGSAINLINVDNKIRFEVNQSSAKNGGVRISSQLTNLAVTIYP